MVIECLLLSFGNDCAAYIFYQSALKAAAKHHRRDPSQTFINRPLFHDTIQAIYRCNGAKRRMCLYKREMDFSISNLDKKINVLWRGEFPLQCEF